MNNESLRRLSEAITAAGMSLREAAAALSAAFEALFSATVENALAEMVINIKYPSDEELRPLATAREWHLMNNAKKYRTRKKYTNRLIKRYINETQTQRRNKP